MPVRQTFFKPMSNRALANRADVAKHVANFSRLFARAADFFKSMSNRACESRQQPFSKKKNGDIEAMFSLAVTIGPDGGSMTKRGNNRRPTLQRGADYTACSMLRATDGTRRAPRHDRARPAGDVANAQNARDSACCREASSRDEEKFASSDSRASSGAFTNELSFNHKRTRASSTPPVDASK